MRSTPSWDLNPTPHSGGRDRCLTCRCVGKGGFQKGTGGRKKRGNGKKSQKYPYSCPLPGSGPNYATWVVPWTKFIGIPKALTEA